jgi:hypothetical protein
LNAPDLYTCHLTATTLNTKFQQSVAKAIPILWVPQLNLGIFIKSQLFSSFFETFGSDFLWLGMGPGVNLFGKL